MLVLWLKRSISRKVMILIIVSIVVPATLSLFITYSLTKRALYENAVRQNTTILAQGADELENYFEALNSASLLVYDHDDLYELLAERRRMTNSELFYALQLIANHDDIHQVYLQHAGSNGAYLFAEGSLSRGDGLREAIAAPSAPYTARIVPLYRSSRYNVIGASYVPSTEVFSVIRSIHRVPTDETIGVLAIDVKPERLMEILSRISSGSKDEVSVLGRDASVLFSTNPESLSIRRMKEIPVDFFVSETPSGWMKFNDSHFKGILFYHRVEAFGAPWLLVKQVANNDLYADATQVTFINSAVMIAFLVVSIAAAALVSLHLITPIKQLIRYANQVRSGNLQPTIRLNRTDEFGTLAWQFQSMVDTINRLIVNEYHVKLAHQQNQINMLQSQINPHFLNNALQSIGSIALDANAPKVYKLIASLGKMMAYSMHSQDRLVPLQEELDHVRHYLALQQQRFEEQFSYRIEAEDEALKIRVPKMTLQPIVENYFKHNEHIRNGRLSVSIRLSDGRLRMCIEDNGAGMNDEQLAEILPQLQRPPNGGNPEERIGLFNVLTRLRYYFGDETNIRIERLNQGLSVCLVIPYRKEGDRP